MKLHIRWLMPRRDMPNVLEIEQESSVMDCEICGTSNAADVPHPCEAVPRGTQLSTIDRMERDIAVREKEIEMAGKAISIHEMCIASLCDLHADYPEGEYHRAATTPLLESEQHVADLCGWIKSNQRTIERLREKILEFTNGEMA